MQPRIAKSNDRCSMQEGARFDDSARRNSIGDALRRICQQQSERVALVFADYRWSFADVDEFATKVANGLRRVGLQHQDRVLVLGRNSDIFFAVWLGVARSGLVFVPVNPEEQAEQLAHIISDCEPAAVVADVDSADPSVLHEITGEGSPDCFLYSSSRQAIELHHSDKLLADILESSPDEMADPICEDDAAQILYTSGSESGPKGVVLTHRALLANFASSALELGYDDRDVMLAALPLFHCGQLNHKSTPVLLRGGSNVILDGFDPTVVLRTINEHRVTLHFGMPSMYEAMLRIPEFEEFDLSSLRFCGANMAPVSQEQLARFRGAFGCEFGTTFGQTEMGPLTLFLSGHDARFKPGSIGRSVWGVETQIMHESGEFAPPGEVGEIVYRGENMMAGYWKREDLTAETIRDGWLHSGDLAYMDEEGFVYFVDRRKDVIKSGGENVSSTEVERVLLSSGIVAEAVVVGVPSDRWGEEVVAVVLPVLGPAQEGASLGAELRSYCRERLAAFKVPKRVHIVDHLPRSHTGKILKREIKRSLIEGSFESGLKDGRP